MLGVGDNNFAKIRGEGGGELTIDWKEIVMIGRHFSYFEKSSMFMFPNGALNKKLISHATRTEN